MTTPKRVAFKDIQAEPLNWKAPNSATQESDSAEPKNKPEDQGSEK